MKMHLKLGPIELNIGAQEKNYLQTVATAGYGERASKPKEYNQAKAMDMMANEVWVYACADLIAKEISALPIRAWRKVITNGKAEYQETDHPALALLNKPNEDGPISFMESLSLNCDLTGNRYTLLDERDAQGHPTRLYSLISSAMYSVPDKTGMTKIARYDYKLKGKETQYPPADIIHGKYTDPRNDYEGLSPLSASRLGLDTMQEARLTNYNIFKNGARLDGYFFAKDSLGDEEHKRVKAELTERYGGAHNAHKTPLLEGVEYKNIAIPAKDLEYIKGMGLGMVEICAVYKVPPVLFDPQYSAYNNLLEAQKFLYKYCIMPRLRYLQGELQRLADTWGLLDIYLEFDLSGVEALKADMDKTSQTAERYFRMGVPLAQLIEFLGLPFDPARIPGADIGYLPFGLMPVGSPSSSGRLTPPPDQEDQDEGKGLGARGKTLRRVKAWTAEMKDRKYQIFKDYTESSERRVRRTYADFFDAQEREVLANIREYKSIGYEVLGAGTAVLALKGVKVGETVAKAIDINSVLFDYDGNVAKYKKMSIPALKEVLKDAGILEMDLLDVGVGFDVDNPRVAKWLNDYALDQAVTVLDSDIDALKELLEAGVEAGSSVDDMVEDIKRYYGDFAPEGYKLERIVRTEVIGASNQGALESYTQAGVERKGWLATRDERTRDTHISAEEDYRDGIGINEDFVVGAGRGPAPGQMGVAEEDINCRCAVFPVIE